MENIDLRALGTLVCIARTGSVTAAAERLRLSQPALTRRIRALEAALGSSVLRRSGRGVALTPAGQQCIEAAERILDELASLSALTRDPTAITGVLRLGVGEVIALCWLHQLIARVRAAYPRLRAELDVDLSQSLIRKLGAGHVDMALLPGPVELAGAVTKSLGFVSLRWMANPRLVRIGKVVSPHELAEAPIVTLPQNAHTYAVMSAWFAASGVTPRRVSACNSFSVLSWLVRQGAGIALLPAELFQPARSPYLVALAARPPLGPVEYSAAYLPGDNAAVLRAVADMAVEESWFAPKASGPWRRSPRHFGLRMP